MNTDIDRRYVCRLCVCACWLLMVDLHITGRLLLGMGKRLKPVEKEAEACTKSCLTWHDLMMRTQCVDTAPHYIRYHTKSSVSMYVLPSYACFYVDFIEGQRPHAAVPQRAFCFIATLELCSASRGLSRVHDNATASEHIRYCSTCAYFR